MKNKLMVSVILVMILFVGCGSSSKQVLEEQKKQEEAEKLQKFNKEVETIVGITGDKPANNELKGLVFITGDEPLNEYPDDYSGELHSCKFLNDSNTVSLTDILFKKHSYTMFRTMYGTYTVNGNKIICDFSSQMAEWKNITRPKCVVAYKKIYQDIINELNEKKVKVGLTEAEEKKLKEYNSYLQTSDEEFGIVTTNGKTYDALLQEINTLPQRAEAILKYNPYTITLGVSPDGFKTLTFGQYFTGDFDGFDKEKFKFTGNAKYAENLVFTNFN